jgi:hypothetical protein
MAAASALPTREVVERRLRAVRAGLVVLAAGQGFAAVWALAAPRSFFDHFPIPGAHWVSALPPFNEHLVRDYGASFLAVTALALAAAWLGDRRLVTVTLGVWLVAAVPHFAFHLAHADEPPGFKGVSSLMTLGFNILLPLVLLYVVRKEIPHGSDRPRPLEGPASQVREPRGAQALRP